MIVVFEGNPAVKWWFLLHRNTALAVTIPCRVASLPDYPHAVFLEPNDDSQIYLPNLEPDSFAEALTTVLCCVQEYPSSLKEPSCKLAAHELPR